MGGIGSTRWAGHRKKDTVESCRQINLNDLFRQRTVAPGLTGTITWGEGETATKAIYEVRSLPGSQLALEVRYPRTPGYERTETVKLMVPLESTAVFRGRIRWWGLCPLRPRDKPCRRRVSKLFQPLYHGSDFGCRHCHCLAYASSQEYDRRVEELIADPKALLRRANDGQRKSPAELSLLLKALEKLQVRYEKFSLIPSPERMNP